MSMDKKRLSKLLYYFSTFDGGVYYSGKNARYVMNMRSENMDYIDWVSDTLREITSVNKHEVIQRGSRQPLTSIASKTHPMLTKIRERIYVENKKVIDPHLLAMFDAEALAIIFMADGGTGVDKRWKQPYASINLHTKGFSYYDNLALSKTMYDKTGIRSTVNKHGKYFYIRIKSKDIQLFIDTVRPYIKPSFYYKLGRLAPCKGVVI